MSELLTFLMSNKDPRDALASESFFHGDGLKRKICSDTDTCSAKWQLQSHRKTLVMQSPAWFLLYSEAAVDKVSYIGRIEKTRVSNEI